MGIILKHITRFLLVLLIAGVAKAQTPTTVAITGTLGDPGGQPVAQSFVRFQLTNCGNNQPRVTGYFGFVSTSKDFVPDPTTGILSGTLWPNDVITCGTTTGGTRYLISISQNGTSLSTTLCYNVLSTQNPFNLNTATPCDANTPPPPPGTPSNATFNDLTLTGFLQGINADFSGTVHIHNLNVDNLNIATLNGIANAGNFAGSDMGAKINAAYASLLPGGSVIQVPPNPAGGCWQFSTPIVFNTPGRYPLVTGMGGSTCIQYTPTSGNAILFDVNGAIAHVTGFGITNLVIMGSGGEFPPVASTATALLIGGTHGAEGFSMRETTVKGFNLGATFGNNTFNLAFFHDVFINNNQNLFWPGNLTNSGERIDFTSTTFAQSVTTNAANCVKIVAEAGISFRFMGGNFDSCQLDLESGTPSGNAGPVMVSGTWFENPAGAMGVPFIQNNGALLSLVAPSFFADTGAPAIPIVAAGPTGIFNPSVFGSFTHIAQDMASWVNLIGNAAESIVSVMPIVGADGTTPSSTSSYYGMLKQPNFFYTSNKPGLAICNGAGSSASCASLDGGILWSAQWAGVPNQYNPVGIRSNGLDDLGFCRADGFKTFAQFSTSGLDCTTDHLTNHVMTTGLGYNYAQKQFAFVGEKPIPTDSDYIVATINGLNASYTGTFNLIWRPIAGGSANRQQAMQVVVQAISFGTASVSVLSNNVLAGQAVITNPRVVTDGSGNLQFVVTMGNRNSTNNQDVLQASLIGDIHGVTTLFPTATLFTTPVTGSGIMQNVDGTYSITGIPSIGSPTVNKAACIKAAGPPVVIGFCSTVVDSSGGCTCN